MIARLSQAETSRQTTPDPQIPMDHVSRYAEHNPDITRTLGRMAAEGNLFQGWWDLGTIAVDLKVIWEKLVNNVTTE